MSETILTLLSQKKKSKAWTPDKLSGLVLWTKADTGTYQDSAKTTPAIADGDPVGAWADNSTNGKDLTSTLTKRPLLKTNILGGKPVIRFDGSDDRLINAAYSQAQPMTVFVVGLIDSTTGNAGNMFFGSYNSTPDAAFYGATAGPYFYMGAGGTAITSPRDFQWNMHCLVFNGASSKNYGNTTAIADASGNPGSNAHSGLSLGQSSGNPNPTAPTYALKGDIAEVIIYSSALSTTNIEKVMQYLKKKYSFVSIVFDGDSLTFGSGSTANGNYPQQCVESLGKTYLPVNLGIAGQLISQIVSNSPAKITPIFEPVTTKICVIWAGTNDLYNSVPAATVFGNIQTACANARAAGYKVVTCTITPNSGVGFPAGLEAARQTVNTNIRNNWASYADALADIAGDSRIGDAGDENDLTYYTSDKVHMNNTGYGVVAGIVKTAIQSLL